MIYFKRLEKLLIGCKTQIKQTDDPHRRQELQARVTLLQEILAYIKKGDWARTKGAYDRVMYTLKYGTQKAAEKYNTSANTIYAGLTRASNRIRTILRDELLDNIESGNVGYARFLFYRNTGQMGELLVDYITDTLPKFAGNMPYNCSAADCAEEIRNLRFYTPRFVDRVLSRKCDKDKLAYINMLLNTKDPAYTEQQYELYRQLYGEKE